MLAGQAVVAIWNGIAEAGRAAFYAWHLHEHMPERVGIPGFRRGRRYRAIDAATRPEFFTLYEADTFEVLQGQDYANRLNAPTPWTTATTAHFLETSRSLARVLRSLGPGPGGVLATMRFRLAEDLAEQAHTALADLMSPLVRLPQVTGAHLCRGDDEASRVRTAESRDRTDILTPPNWFVLVEACTAEALEEPARRVAAVPGVQALTAGRYVHEYTRLKTDSAPG